MHTLNLFGHDVTPTWRFVEVVLLEVDGSDRMFQRVNEFSNHRVCHNDGHCHKSHVHQREACAQQTLAQWLLPQNFRVVCVCDDVISGIFFLYTAIVEAVFVGLSAAVGVITAAPNLARVFGHISQSLLTKSLIHREHF